MKTNVPERLLQVLNISELQYNKYVFELAYTYLQKLTDNKTMVHSMTLKKGFWIWWTNQFLNIDLQFLTEYSHRNDLKSKPYGMLLNIWVNMHINTATRPDAIIYKLQEIHEKSINNKS